MHLRSIRHQFCPKNREEISLASWAWEEIRNFGQNIYLWFEHILSNTETKQMQNSWNRRFQNNIKFGDDKVFEGSCDFQIRKVSKRELQANFFLWTLWGRVDMHTVYGCYMVANGWILFLGEYTVPDILSNIWKHNCICDKRLEGGSEIGVSNRLLWYFDSFIITWKFFHFNSSFTLNMYTNSRLSHRLSWKYLKLIKHERVWKHVHCTIQ